jgi:hypothetical protein
VTSISIPFGADSARDSQLLLQACVHLQHYRPSRYEEALSLAMGLEA